MLAKLMKQASVMALLIAIFVSTSPKIGLLLCGIVSLGAWIACGDAFRVREYGWSTSFLVVVFSTFFLAMLPQSYTLMFNFLCLGLFVSSVVHSRELLTSRVAAKTF